MTLVFNEALRNQPLVTQLSAVDLGGNGTLNLYDSGGVLLAPVTLESPAFIVTESVATLSGVLPSTAVQSGLADTFDIRNGDGALILTGDIGPDLGPSPLFIGAGFKILSLTMTVLQGTVVADQYASTLIYPYRGRDDFNVAGDVTGGLRRLLQLPDEYNASANITGSLTIQGARFPEETGQDEYNASGAITGTITVLQLQFPEIPAQDEFNVAGGITGTLTIS